MKTNANHQYLSERFSRDTFANMTSATMYAFYSAPDTGKTTMIINVLQPYLKDLGKTALYLSHRKVINDQNEANFDETVIHSKTYQKVEDDIIKNNSFMRDYDFIICDECHYFVEDSIMNNNTDISFDFVNKSKAIVILMTGTPDYLQGISELWHRPIEILVDVDKSNHNVAQICLAQDTKEEEALLKVQLERLVKMKKRILVYDSNIAELYQLSTEYKQRQQELGIKVSFICSKRNREYSPYSDTDELDILTETRHTTSDLLFITSALNTGVSIDEDFEYLFIFGNPSKTDIVQLIARVRKGHGGRKLKTIYCTVPKFHSIRCRLEGLELDLTYLKDPKQWQTTTKSRSFPRFMQMQYSYVYNSNGEQSFTPEGNPVTEYRQAVNYMILGKFKQDILDYKDLMRDGSMMNAYRMWFDDRYNNISITTLKEELEVQGVQEIVGLINSCNHLEYLYGDIQETIKDTCLGHGLLTSIGKINELLIKYNSDILLVSRQKKLKGQKVRPWYVERY